MCEVFEALGIFESFEELERIDGMVVRGRSRWDLKSVGMKAVWGKCHVSLIGKAPQKAMKRRQ